MFNVVVSPLMETQSDWKGDTTGVSQYAITMKYPPNSFFMYSKILQMHVWAQFQIYAILFSGVRI